MLLCQRCFSGNGLGTAVGLVSTSSRVGAILGNLILGALLASRSWQVTKATRCHNSNAMHLPRSLAQCSLELLDAFLLLHL